MRRHANLNLENETAQEIKKTKQKTKNRKNIKSNKTGHITVDDAKTIMENNYRAHV